MTVAPEEAPEARPSRLPADYMYFEIDELAEMLCVAPSTVRTLMRKEDWPHSKVGVKVIFALADIDIIRERIQVDVNPVKHARSTKIGTQRSRRLAHAYNVRNGLVER